MKKFKVFFNIVEEEKWLNEQLQKGYRCAGISNLGIYTFEKMNEDHVIRLDYQSYLSKDEFSEYKMVYDDFGWSHVKGSRLGGIQYWQKEDDGQNEIFSDRESTGNYYKKLMGYSFWLGMLCLAYSYLLYKDHSELYHEGLWSMNGALFWKAFLFETPFVVLKLLPALLVVLFGSSFYKAYRKYSMLKEK